MMPAATPRILSMRPLTEAEASAPATKNVIKKLRDPHHLLAKHFAMGFSVTEAAETCGFSISRASLLRSDPMFAELVEEYRKQIDERSMDAVDEYYQRLARIRSKTANMIEEKLDSVDNVNDISFRDLANLHSDAADRTGYPRRKEAINLNADFASLLDQAIQRSNKAKLVNPSGALPADAGSEGGRGEDRASTPKVIEATSRRM